MSYLIGHVRKPMEGLKNPMNQTPPLEPSRYQRFALTVTFSPHAVESKVDIGSGFPNLPKNQVGERQGVNDHSEMIMGFDSQANWKAHGWPQVPKGNPGQNLASPIANFALSPSYTVAVDWGSAEEAHNDNDKGPENRRDVDGGWEIKVETDVVGTESFLDHVVFGDSTMNEFS